jgi:uridine kinase
MLGDVLLIREFHKEAAQNIWTRVKEDWNSKRDKDKNYKYIVGISGESGAGKSELSHSLAQLLKKEGIRVKVLHTDNYYIIPPLLRNEWRKAHGLDTVGVNEYDWKLIHRNINDFKEDRESMMPCIDIVSEQVDKLITDFRKIQVLVIDGLYAIKSENIDMRVFIELTYHETKIAQIVRAKEAQDEFRYAILEREHRNVQSLKPLADLLVDKSYSVVVPKKVKKKISKIRELINS